MLRRLLIVGIVPVPPARPFLEPSPRTFLLEVRRTELLPENSERELDDEQEDPSSRRESQHFGQKARVQRRDALLLGDQRERRERPVVLGRLTRHLDRVLHSRFHNVDWGGRLFTERERERWGRGGVNDRSVRSEKKTGNRVLIEVVLQGVLSAVPTKPPTAPETKSLNS